MNKSKGINNRPARTLMRSATIAAKSDINTITIGSRSHTSLVLSG